MDENTARKPDPDGMEAIIAAYRKDIDRTRLRENLKLTPEQRVRRLMSFLRFVEELRRAGAASGDRRGSDGPRLARPETRMPADRRSHGT